MRCTECKDYFQSEYEMQTVCGECQPSIESPLWKILDDASANHDYRMKNDSKYRIAFRLMQEATKMP